MAKPMTSEEIESELAACEARASENWFYRTKHELHAAFALGQDNGKAIMLERAKSLIAQRFVDEKTSALGAAIVTILAWVALVKGRMWSPGSCYAMAYAGDAEAFERVTDSNGKCHTVDADDPAEAITKLAAWCAEHMASSAEKRDTLPAPPAEVFETADAKSVRFPGLCAIGDTEEFGGTTIHAGMRARRTSGK